MLAFMGVMVLGVPYATNTYPAFVVTKDLLIWFFGAAMPLMAFVSTYRRLRRFIWLFALLHIPLTIYCLAHNGVGVGGFLSDENDFCLALNIAVPYVFFSLFFVERVWQKALLALTLCLLLYATTATMSRGGFLGIVAVAAVCWAFSPRKLVSLAVLIALSVPLLALIPDKFWNEMKTIETADQEGDTGEQRLYLWGMAWRMFLDHPIMGVGPYNYQFNNFMYEKGAKQDGGLHVWGKPAHSIYFTILPEEGIVGILVFVPIIVLNVTANRRIRKRYKRCKADSSIEPDKLRQLYVVSVLSSANDAAMLGFFVTGAFLSVLYYPHFWLQTTFGMVLTRVFWSLVPPEQPVPIPARRTIGQPRQPRGVLKPQVEY
jgi:probable O-glycosylation ligase (exosortase A-associated)